MLYGRAVFQTLTHQFFPLVVDTEWFRHRIMDVFLGEKVFSDEALLAAFAVLCPFHGQLRPHASVWHSTLVDYCAPVCFICDQDAFVLRE